MTENSSKGTDNIFAESTVAVADFKFGAKTVAVFDDMVGRSVPFYAEIQRMCCEMAADFAVPGSRLYDYGCATGTTMLALDPLVAPGVQFVGLDNSAEMLDKCREKLAGIDASRALELINTDLNNAPPIKNASVALQILTLQFIRPLNREQIVSGIFDGLTENGCLILVEKILSPSGMLNRQFIKYYYEMKRRHGYSDMEISQKREALENVLVPYHYEENMELLRRVGFTQVEEFFRWYNFCGIIAVK